MYWVSVESLLPSSSSECVLFVDGRIRMGRYVKSKRLFEADDGDITVTIGKGGPHGVTHWMQVSTPIIKEEV